MTRSSEFTGFRLLLIMLAFFGVVIGVNVTMAVFANTSWTGLVVKNSYVASQHFNEQAAEQKAQAETGWVGTLAVDNGGVSYAIADAGGRPIRLADPKITFHRPVSGQHDVQAEMKVEAAGSASAALDLGDGVWIVTVTADAGLPFPWRDMRRIVIKDGIFR